MSSPEGAMAEACSEPIEAFLSCSCHVPAGQIQDHKRCSKALCQELESQIRECSQKHLQSALSQVEAECPEPLDHFVRCVYAAGPHEFKEKCAQPADALRACSLLSLGQVRSHFFSPSLSRPASLVSYRVASGKTQVPDTKREDL
uniref:IMS import disulfide relay-system CHCH-CHCH-like Cx9C domain-containing protein n=2 Tax=Hemiselmis andersenii TaxID=464988 RepID=A0A7S1DST1_HEMAN|mmetsp:Transcript_25918/g.62884  ORF Transcript_25918/g.62884 Transcript_25918/m.62884 type:complete len:145 (+) Transcript_25918:209-643(+)